ncbi:MAG: ribosomal L5P family protein,Ribosomal protein L5 [Candidatus Berkelbacteria bacterium Licking1014_85]|uniref:Large ribosomal subunit protein uL5 n=1 Tax=Candidatus Berkelbacteria bacterium Licking1014_85 TaxID=2017148 RepID=A0A554LM10_9BACT|nr:MAG: ribosomal L5P family protein,Ribosomal protein L5 [Candidatus Berkelbacteria bacterium Licking1014_85]
MINIKSINQKIAEEFKINSMSVPKILKIVVSAGTGNFRDNENRVKNLQTDLSKITGQMPAFTTAKKSISGFKLRKGEHVGLKVTLRDKLMWDFLDRLVNITFPLIRDFKGISQKAFDKSGNLSIGIKEHIVFPEIAYDTQSGICGLQITINFSQSNRQIMQKMLEYIGFPLQKEK